jgi:hypothetical protein
VKNENPSHKKIPDARWRDYKSGKTITLDELKRRLAEK